MSADDAPAVAIQHGHEYLERVGATPLAPTIPMCLCGELTAHGRRPPLGGGFFVWIEPDLAARLWARAHANPDQSSMKSEGRAGGLHHSG
jgi:hypothetical protein